MNQSNWSVKVASNNLDQFHFNIFPQLIGSIELNQTCVINITEQYGHILIIKISTLSVQSTTNHCNWFLKIDIFKNMLQKYFWVEIFQLGNGQYLSPEMGGGGGGRDGGFFLGQGNIRLISPLTLYGRTAI